MTGDFGKQPHLDDVLDSLFSLLPENSPHENSEHNSELAFKEGDSGIFYQALFYSIANGFAGLTNIPPGAILKMLRQGDMSSRLIEWINSCPHIQAKCLADNLFRAAVEACDEDALMLVLKATDGTPSAIEPNQVVCKLGNRKYTPIELAAKLRHLNIVNRLLAANVDVNKTYGQLKYPECGALELAIRKYGDFEPVDVKLVQNILRFGAEVRGDLISAAIRWGQTEVIDELVSRFLPTSHRERFEKSVYALLQGIAHHLGNEHATRLIKRIFEHCRIDTCNCLAVHTREVENTLREAARRGNIELVKFLRPHTKKTVGLPAAVKSGNRELIDFLLSHGADVGEVALSEFKFRNEKFGSETTPLAEAIRSQNKELVIEFEILGAMSHVSQKAHFRAATIAAVEINDCNYLERIFQQAPAFETSREWSSCLRLPLSIAIHNDNIETALLLLEKGAEVNEETRIFSVNQNGSVNGPSLVLMEALRKKHRALVNAILDADFDFDGQSAAMELAAMWGDMPVIEGMIATGARADDGMIGAVKTRNGKLLDFLIRLGASLRVRSESKETLLQAAAVNQDGHMISLLILHGADPADEGAFLSAIEMSDPRTFDTLLEAFSGRYPNGKLGFGGVVLIKAIEKDDIQLLNALLAAKLDVKSFVRENYSEITPLGFAIKHCKGADRGLAGVRKLIPHGNTNGVVFRERSEIGPILGMSGKTALILAVETRNEEMVHLLLKNNANIHEPARRGLKRTPLQRACEIGSFKMVKLLLASGATVNEQPAERDGATSLQLAAKSGSIKIAEFLLSRGAIVHETQCKVRGYTAFEAAAGNGRLEMMIFLWDKVAGMGFTTEQMERAKHLAISGNHRGCADYIDTLSPPLPFLEAGSSSAFI
jgi:ankyrin repeat protein